MKSPLSAKAAVFAAGYCLLSNLFAAGILVADYDRGQMAGSSPVWASEIVPLTNKATTAVTVVTRTGNPAGGGAANGFRILDNGGSAAGLEMNFAGSAAGEVPGFRADFDVARLAAGTASSTLVFAAENTVPPKACA